MADRPHALLALSAAFGLAGIGIVATVPPADAATPSVTVNAKCSGHSVVNLQLQREDNGALGVDFGVDMARHKAGVVWKVVETRNGTAFVTTSVKTVSDGSFSISSVLSSPGTTTVAGKAVNAASGETCSISSTIA